MSHPEITIPTTVSNGPTRTSIVPGVSVSVRTWDDVDATLLSRWRKLETRSLTSAPFQSAHFVAAAVENLKVANPLLITIERGEQLVGLGLFESIRACRRMPIPHLRSWQTPHTFTDTMLIDRDDAQPTANAFWEWLSRDHDEWHAVEFPRFQIESPLAELFDHTMMLHGVDHCTGRITERASIELQSSNDDLLLSSVSSRRARSLRRGWRWLQKQGDVDFVVVREPEEMDQATEELLALEAMGWKADIGTALAVSAEQTAFFRQMVRSFANENRIAFSQIRVEKRPVASVVHLLHGNTASAFKLGWDPAFERGCPGFQLKALLCSHADAELPELRLIDSCSQPGSFIENVWPHRMAIANRMYCTTNAGHLAGAMVGGLRWVRNHASALWNRLDRGKAGS